MKTLFPSPICARPILPLHYRYQIEHDCPASLVPYHVKPIPEPVSVTVEDIPEDYHKGEVWNKQLCPDWCMAEEPVSKMPTESGPVDVRECSPEESR